MRFLLFLAFFLLTVLLGSGLWFKVIPNLWIALVTFFLLCPILPAIFDVTAGDEPFTWHAFVRRVTYYAVTIGVKMAVALFIAPVVIAVDLLGQALAPLAIAVGALGGIGLFLQEVCGVALGMSNEPGVVWVPIIGVGGGGVLYLIYRGLKRLTRRYEDGSIGLLRVMREAGLRVVRRMKRKEQDAVKPRQ